jgi:hypothetical protein
MGTVRVEVEIENRGAVEAFELEGATAEAVLARVRALTGFDDLHVFERDSDEPISSEIERRKALSLHGHRCRKVLVKVRYEHRTEEHHFGPAAHVQRVLLWAIGKKGFDLDDTARAKANLILPGAEQPLPKDAVIGSLVKHDTCQLTLDLTLKDFTTG